MRSLVFCVIVSLSLTTWSTEGNQLSFSLLNSEANGYKNFIQVLRHSLTENTNELYGIPILKNSLPASQRFITSTITNQFDETITLAIDKVNLRVVGYLSKDTSFMFLDAPREAFQVVFPSTRRVILSFNSDYQSIETAAGTTRQKTVLGSNPMHVAISILFHYRRNSLPYAFLVILQMVVEGLKFKFIEQSVFMSLKYGYNFKPSLAILSLEDNWSRLSLQIQASPSLQGLFGEVVELYDSNDEVIQVDATDYPIIITNIAVQLYHCNVSTNIIKMTVKNDPCYVESRTTRISGRAGHCLDVEKGLSNDGTPIILFPCGPKVNQQWTFQSDGTIQSLGKCLAFNDTNFVVIYNCRKAAPNSIKWKVSMDGTISNNPSSGFVLTANSPEIRTKLKMEPDTQAFSQCWRVGNYIEPIVGSLVGFYGLCLKAANNNITLALEDCVKGKKEQYWAFYGDGTIRVNSSRNLCVSTSSLGCSLGQHVIILECNGSSSQRWDFKADGTILNPICGRVMDVNKLWDIILYPKTGEPTQEWNLFY